MFDSYQDAETLEDLRASIPRHITVRERAVNSNDYIEVLEENKAIAQVKVVLDDFFARSVRVHVLPTAANSPTAELLTEVQDFLNARNMITEIVTAQSPTYKLFNCAISVKPAVGFSNNAAVFAARTAISAYLDSANLGFDAIIEKGQIHAATRALDEVEFISVDELYWNGDPVGASTLTTPTNEVPKLNAYSVVTYA